MPRRYTGKASQFCTNLQQAGRQNICPWWVVPPGMLCFQVLHGRSWIIVDGAILDVSTFAKRHPGGARLIINAMGTDITSEIMGEEASIGNSNMAFTPHPHTDVSLDFSIFKGGSTSRAFARVVFRVIPP